MCWEGFHYQGDPRSCCLLHRYHLLKEQWTCIRCSLQFCHRLLTVGVWREHPKCYIALLLEWNHRKGDGLRWYLRLLGGHRRSTCSRRLWCWDLLITWCILCLSDLCTGIPRVQSIYTYINCIRLPDNNRQDLPVIAMAGWGLKANVWSGHK